MPRISVVVATYNWSSALRVALQSIRAQTFEDYEVLVVGDACTDDSAQAVAELGDPRFSFHNLASNCGSQWGPNNRGLELARGGYIAYLGHDDLWWPTHLEVAHRRLEQTGADLAAAAALLYGPPESGVRAVSGFFPNGAYSPRIFFPPSSLVHRRALAQRIGGWRSPEQCTLATDFDFLVRCHEAGAKFAATGELTVFKFTSGWQRDAYRKRDASRQRAFLERMQRDGDRFRIEELTASLHTASEGRLYDVAAAGPKSGGKVREFKGASSRNKADADSGTWIDGKLRFEMRDDYQGFEWEPLEEQPGAGRFRWSGPSRQSTIVLPVKPDRLLDISILVVGWISEATLHSARLLINDVAVEARLEPHGEGKFLWRAGAEPGTGEEIEVTIEVDRTQRPFDLGLGNDRRWLGVAVAWVEVGSAADAA